VCVCLLLQDLVQSCLQGGGGDVIHTRTHFKGCAFSRLPVCGATPLCGFPPIVCFYSEHISLTHISRETKLRRVQGEVRNVLCARELAARERNCGASV
jgi:hypothetical protein